MQLPCSKKLFRLHQRVGVILGSRNEVERVTGYHQAG